MAKTSGVDLEAKAGAGVPNLRQFAAVHCYVLATPATPLEPTVLASAVALDHFSDVKMGDLLHGKQSILHIYFTQVSRTGEDTPSSLCSVGTTREAAVYW